MSQDLAELDRLHQRIDHLERQNRRVRRAGIALASAGAFLGLLGMAAPALCDTIYAERLVLRDPAGQQRIVADAYGGAPAFSLLSKDGRALARIGVARDGEAYLTFFDAQGKEKGTWKGNAPSGARPETKATGQTDRTVSVMR